jgi:hypothetical protein
MVHRATHQAVCLAGGLVLAVERPLPIPRRSHLVGVCSAADRVFEVDHEAERRRPPWAALVLGRMGAREQVGGPGGRADALLGRFECPLGA